MEDIAKAIHTDDMGLLKSALSRVDPNARDPKMGNAAPINIAAFMGKKDAIETILAAGASPNTQDERGATPLILAVVNGHVDVVGVLLRARADTNIKDQKGACPIILASFNGIFAMNTIASSTKKVGAQETLKRKPIRLNSVCSSACTSKPNKPTIAKPSAPPIASCNFANNA